MLTALAQLLVLQDRDRKIRALKTELKLAPQERKDVEEHLSASTQQLEGAKHRGREIEVERKKLEIEAQAKRDTIAKYNVQKFQTRKNEEFQALTNEVKRFEGEITILEDRELELMESADKQKLVIAEADKEASSVKALVERQRANLDEKIGAIGAQLGELEAERAKLAEKVEEDLLDTYNRLFTSKGDSAVVAFEHDHCMGCHMKLTAATSARVKAGREVCHCEQCGRILYWER